MFVIKLQYEQDIRRVSIEKTISLVELRELAKSLFKDTLPESFLLKYKDDEGDLCLITTDRELQEGFRVFEEQGILKISIVGVHNKNSNKPKAEEKSPFEEVAETIQPYLDTIETQFMDVFPKIEERMQEIFPKIEEVLPLLEEKFMEMFGEVKEPERPVIHLAICDNCNKRIVGIRWKCTSCPDYDLCNSCKQTDVHKEHKFLQIDKVIYGHCPFRPSQGIPVKKEEEQPKPQSSPKVEKKEETKVESPKISPNPVRVVKIETPQSPKKEEKVPESPKVEKKEEPKPQTPAVEKKEEPKPLSSFEAKLAQLAEMGFLNRGRNIELLVKCKGDMIEVVRYLLE